MGTVSTLRTSRPPIAGLIGIGLGAGFLSGLFGVGGGLVIVPALVAMAHMPRKLASGTSLVAIIPTALVGVLSYAVKGNVDVVVALVLAAGSVVGAQVGAWLLHRLPVRVVRWAFMAFMLAAAVSLFVTVPARGATFSVNPGSIAGLVVLGVATGIMSGLLGVGGGLVVVPVLIVVFGVSDLVTKGSSLLMMIPTAISGTVGNIKRGNADVRSGLIVGGAACLTSAAGAWVSQHLDPRAANIAFAVFIGAVLVQMIIQSRTRKDA
jgi:uncharacterized membrane protein YfcA